MHIQTNIRTYGYRRIYANLSINPPAYLSICLPFYPSIYLFIYLPVHRWILSKD